MKLIYLLLITFCLVGCRKENGLSNPYYDRMKKLAEEAQANPNDKTALDKLEKYTTDPDYWNRYYAYCYLEELAIKNVGDCQNEVIPYLDKALKDPDQAIRRDAASGIGEIGTVAVDKTLSTLLDTIQTEKYEDVADFSIEAVGKLENRQKAPDALIILLKVANAPPPIGDQEEAPQARYAALDSIVSLSTKNDLNAVPELEKLLNESQSPYKERVAKAILELDSANQTAQKVLNSSEVK